MKLNYYAIYDQKAKAYLTPFCMHNDAMAVRGFGDAINDPATRFGQHPEDYLLYQLAEWHDDSGEFVPQDPGLVVNGISLVNIPPPIDKAEGLAGHKIAEFENGGLSDET